MLLMIFPFIRHSMNVRMKAKYSLGGCESYLDTCGMSFYSEDTPHSSWQKIIVMIESSVAGIFTPIFPFISIYLIGISASIFILIALQ